MMLQPAGAPGYVPNTFVTGVPIQSMSYSTYYNLGDAQGVQAQYQLINSQIRSDLEKPFTVAATGARVYQFRIFIDMQLDMNTQWGHVYKIAYNSNYAAGMTMSYPGSQLETASTVVQGSISPGGYIVHEFGHHLDATFNQLFKGGSIVNAGVTTVYPAGLGYQQNLTAQAPFTTLFAASNPTIPAGTYGKDNIIEWFADSWRFIVQNGSSGLLALGGNDKPRAIQINAAFSALMPVPTVTW